MSGVRIRNLRKSFGAVEVLGGVDVDVREGEFCILLGPSGCGKTTLLRIVAGLEGHDGGEVWIGDREVSLLTPAERDVAMVFQSYALYPHMTVYENLAFPLKARRAPKAEIREKVEEAARLLELQDLLGRRPRELSGGQRQRVAIGRAIVRTPAVFLFDEPLSNLDAKLRSAMRVELAKLHRRLGATMVYVTHDQVEAMTLGQRIVLLHEGTVQQVGAPRDLYERPANLFVATFVGTPAMNVLGGALRSGAGGLVFEAPGVRLSLGWRDDLAAHAGEAVHLGVRPEALVPVAGGGEGEVEGRLELVESLGAECLLHVAVGEVRVVARAGPDWTGERDAPVALSVRGPGVHVFHDGRRIGGGGAPAAPPTP